MTREEAHTWLQMESTERINTVRKEMPNAPFVELDRECTARHREALYVVGARENIPIYRVK